MRIPSACALALVLAACSSRPAAPNYAVPGPAAAPPPAYATAPGPYAVPAGPAQPTANPVQFRFQVGDELAVAVWKEPELATTQRIMPDGTISPLLLKTVPVVGATVDDVRERLEREYATLLKDPRVSVRVTAIHSDRVFVVGEVREPAAVPLNGPTTVVQAIAMAGGFEDQYAQKNGVRVIRAAPDGSPQAHLVNVGNVLAGLEPDVAVRRGDIVFVPARGVSEWARTVGQALSPLSAAIGTAGSISTIYTATK